MRYPSSSSGRLTTSMTAMTMMAMARRATTKTDSGCCCCYCYWGGNSLSFSLFLSLRLYRVSPVPFLVVMLLSCVWMATAKCPSFLPLLQFYQRLPLPLSLFLFTPPRSIGPVYLLSPCSCRFTALVPPVSFGAATVSGNGTVRSMVASLVWYHLSSFRTVTQSLLFTPSAHLRP